MRIYSFTASPLVTSSSVTSFSFDPDSDTSMNQRKLTAYGTELSGEPLQCVIDHGGERTYPASVEKEIEKLSIQSAKAQEKVEQAHLQVVEADLVLVQARTLLAQAEEKTASAQ